MTNPIKPPSVVVFMAGEMVTLNTSAFDAGLLTKRICLVKNELHNPLN